MIKSLSSRFLLVLLLTFTISFLPACKGSSSKQPEKSRKIFDDEKIETLRPIRLAQLKRPIFTTARALESINHLSATIGSRRQGTSQEKAAANYIVSEFEKMGYSPQVQPFSLPDGSQSQNVIVTKVGKDTSKRLVVGAHYDTKTADCPGADDNASGVGIMLELAHALKNYPTYPTIDFVAFGAEELFDSNKDNHHFGSRYYVDSLSSSNKSQVFGMISVDMVGVGSNFHVRFLGTGSRIIVDGLISKSAEIGRTATYLSDPGWSDHEAFERAGIPSAWLQWRPNPNYHSPKDTYGTIKPGNIEITGKICLDFILSLDENKLNELLGQS